MKYQLICMSFDGDYKRETPEFESIADAWDYSNDLGSKWYFYPFHFIVSRETVKSSGPGLGKFINKRIKTLKREFFKASLLPEMQDVGCEEFAMIFEYM